MADLNDHNIKAKEQDKVEKYQDIRLEIQRLWNVKAQVVPVVIGALGSTTPNFVRLNTRENPRQT